MIAISRSHCPPLAMDSGLKHTREMTPLRNTLGNRAVVGIGCGTRMDVSGTAMLTSIHFPRYSTPGVSCFSAASADASPLMSSTAESTPTVAKMVATEEGKGELMALSL